MIHEPAARTLDSGSSSRQRARTRGLCWGLAIASLLVLLLVAHRPLLSTIAAVLVVEDALQPGAAIVVLAGGPPFREMEAADLYRAGWAPRVIVVREVDWEEHQAFRRLRIAVPERWELSRRVLTELGVPATAIVTPGERARNTLDELRIAYHAIAPDGAPVLLVTSKIHTRRVAMTWRHVAGDRSPGIVRGTRYDTFAFDRWWLEGRFLTGVAREYAGLAGYGVRFLLPGRE